MSSIIRYRGALRDIRDAITLEDRITQVAIEAGGFANICRSRSAARPDRDLSGVLLDLAPGIGTVHLLFWPDGRLVDFEPAADHWVSVDTRFGTAQARFALLELLSALKAQFLPDLEVECAAGETPGDARLAQSVRRAIERPPEFPRVRFADDDGEWFFDDRKEGTEAEWRALAAQELRTQADAMRDFDLALATAMVGRADQDAADQTQEAEADEEAWRESVRTVWDASEEAKLIGSDAHPLSTRVKQVILDVDRLSASVAHAAAHRQLQRALGELMGGLAQALDGPLDDVPYGLMFVQLERGMRGAAFARGALPLALGEGNAPAIDRELESMECAMREEISRVRREWSRRT